MFSVRTLPSWGVPPQDALRLHRRTRLGLPVLGAIALFLTYAVAAFQNHGSEGLAVKLGGDIALSKSLWLSLAVVLWFFVAPLLAFEPALPRNLRVTFLAFSVSMWLRGPLELYLLYGPKIWSPKMGIAHDLITLLLVVGLSLLLRRGSTGRQNLSVQRFGVLALTLLGASLLIEVHHAWRFFEIVQHQTQGEHAIWFASEADPRFQSILFWTKIGNASVIAGWLALIVLTRKVAESKTGNPDHELRFSRSTA
jgi:hypothetical protein